MYGSKYMRGLSELIWEYQNSTHGRRTLDSYMKWHVIKFARSALSEPYRDAGKILEKVSLFTLAWWQLWNFIECQAKFNRFLYPNEHIQRIFWYLVRLFESELSKIGNFQSLESFLEAKFHLIILKMIFSSEYQSRRTPFIKYICNLKHFHQSLFSKNVP